MALLRIPPIDRDVSPTSAMALSFRDFIRRTPSPHSQKSLPPSPNPPTPGRTSSVYSRAEDSWPLESQLVTRQRRETTASFLSSHDDESGWDITAASMATRPENPYSWPVNEGPAATRSHRESLSSLSEHSSGSDDSAKARGRTTERTESGRRRSIYDTLDIHYGPPASTTMEAGGGPGTTTAVSLNERANVYDNAYRALRTEQKYSRPEGLGPIPPSATASDLKLVPTPLFFNPRQISLERTRDYQRSRLQPGTRIGGSDPKSSSISGGTGKMEISWPFERPLNLTAISNLAPRSPDKRSPGRADDPTTSLLGRFASPPRAKRRGLAHFRIKSDGRSPEPRPAMNFHTAKAMLADAVRQGGKSKAEKRREELKRSIRVIHNVD